MIPRATIAASDLRAIGVSSDIKIPRPVKETPAGNPLSYFDWRYPFDPAYEAQIAPTLPAGWATYQTIDRERHPDICSRDFGATRRGAAEGVANVFGVRELDGTPKHLRAYAIETRLFAPHDLAAACAWCDEQIAKHPRST